MGWGRAGDSRSFPRPAQALTNANKMADAPRVPIPADLSPSFEAELNEHFAPKKRHTALEELMRIFRGDPSGHPFTLDSIVAMYGREHIENLIVEALRADGEDKLEEQEKGMPPGVLRGTIDSLSMLLSKSCSVGGGAATSASAVPPAPAGDKKREAEEEGA